MERAAKGAVSYREFFQNAPELNPNRKLIKGVVSGVRVEDIDEPLMREIRYLMRKFTKCRRERTKKRKCGRTGGGLEFGTDGW